MMESNEVLERLPRHLMNLVIDQPYHTYTAQDHAVWRYVMRQNTRYLPAVAHHSYLEGLKKTGIGIDCIPHMYGMNRIMQKIGWATVAVDGFIPPAAFMEFQAYNVLVIAADIRPVNQILYTPAPDIIHEAAGHAPIIADEEYAKYLRDFGILGAKAFSSAYDNRIYEAIRHLSILKANPYSSFESIEKAEAELEFLNTLQEMPSEMALLRNLHWWTVEYGLIGNLEKPKIYGAGLLSSISESYNCLTQKVKKIPYSIEAQNFTFDITNEQPQLFVTPNFEYLHKVLNEFKQNMALNVGGKVGLEKALRSVSIATITYNSGLQVSGKLIKIHSNKNEPVYLSFLGPVMLSADNQMLEGHSKHYHKDGYSAPIGKIKDIDADISKMSLGELASYGISIGNEVRLDFVNGVKVKGRLEQITRKNGVNLLLTFSGCYVRFQGSELFNPSWGLYDMAVGETITSTFSGPADADSYHVSYSAPEEKTIHINYSEDALKLHEMYAKVREIRENNINLEALILIWRNLKINYPEEWLLPLELSEILSGFDKNSTIFQEIIQFLKIKSDSSPDLKRLIADGLSFLSNK